MRARSFLPLLLVLAACTATPRTTPATPEGPSEYFEVVALKHAHCVEVRDVLKTIYGAEITERVAVVPRTNSILVAGAQADVARVVTTIRQLDDELRVDDAAGAGD